MEFVNAAHAHFIKNDHRMLWQPEKANPKQEGATFKAVVRSSNLCQELGQIDYIFSDKTGTLTQNVMEFKRCSILGETFGTLGSVGFTEGRELINSKLQKAGPEEKAAIERFWEILGVCHTVVASDHEASANKSGKKYEAESPDEQALVRAAADMGWAFEGRTGSTMKVKRSGDSIVTYEHMAENKFDSVRKRMSVVVKHGDKYLLLAKGADNMMMERARPEDKKDKKLLQHLEGFAVEGLRTLVLGYKESHYIYLHSICSIYIINT